MFVCLEVFSLSLVDCCGGVQVTPAGYAYLTQQLLTIGCPVVVALEGGYNVTAVKRSFCATVAALCGVSDVDGASFAAAKPDAEASIAACVSAQKPFWKCLQ